MKELKEYTDKEIEEEVERRKPAEDEEEKEGYAAVCCDCKKDTTVPFKPRAGWDVRCYECYKKFKGN